MTKLKKTFTVMCVAAMMCAATALPASASYYGGGSVTLSGKANFDKDSRDNSWYKNVGYCYCKTYEGSGYQKLATIQGFYNDYLTGDTVRTSLHSFPSYIYHSAGIHSGGKNVYTSTKKGGLVDVTEYINLKSNKATFDGSVTVK